MRIVFDMMIVEQERSEAFFSTCALLDKLARIDQTNEYILVTGRPQDYRFQSSSANIQIYPLKLHSWQGVLTQHQLVLPGVLRKIQPDILHVPDGAAPIGWNGILIMAIYNPSLLDEQYQSSHLHYQLFWKYLLNESIRRAQFIITSSEHNREELLKRWTLAQERVYTILNKASASETLQVYQIALKQQKTSHI